MTSPTRLNKYSEAILAIIQKNPEPVPFSTIWRKCGFSKSTVSKYLKQLEAARLVDKIREKHSRRSTYRPTARGINEPTGGPGTRDLRTLVKFYSALNVPESTTWQITQLILEKMDKFLDIPQSPELYLALFYVYCNIITVKRFMPRKEFREMYHIKRLALDYHVDKILDADLGFHQIVCTGLDYFFHDIDELGVNLHQLAEARIVQFLLQKQYENVDSEKGSATATGRKGKKGVGGKLPLEKIAWEVVEELHKRTIIGIHMRDAFMYYARGYLVKMAMERNIPPEMLPELQEPDSSPSTSIEVEELRGFCSRCGNWVLQGQFTCTRCQQAISERELVFDCLVAQERTREYRNAFLSDTTTCEHCGHVYPGAWNLESCPNCQKKQ